jgi:hypothetical protein
MTDKKSSSKRERRRAYPIRCIDCGRVDVFPAVVQQTIRRNHDGRIYELVIDDLPAAKCRACGAVSFAQDSDDRIIGALREHLHLLTPEQIRANLAYLNLSQKDGGAALGVAPETLSRWLSGGLVQSRAMDNLMRAFFGSPEVRRGLTSEEGRGKFGKRAAPELLALGTAKLENVGMLAGFSNRRSIDRPNPWANVAQPSLN